MLLHAPSEIFARVDMHLHPVYNICDRRCKRVDPLEVSVAVVVDGHPVNGR
jgi:hypothetical protein